MKFYEVLNNIQLIIHIQADDAVLHDLEQHWTDIKSIGRSEDMVDIQQAKVIDLVETGNVSATSEYSAYIDSEALKLDENSNVLVISTEGDTDPVRYREIVWDGLYGTNESLSK